MKKLFVLLALISILALVLLGCNKNEELNDELEREILEDFLITSALIGDISPEDINYTCFGQFGDSVAIYFHTSGAYKTPIKEEIAGFKFNYPDSRVVKIWNNGKFYKIGEAFEKGLITESDIETIHKNAFLLIHKNPLFIYEKKQESFIPEIEYTSEFGNLLMNAGIGVKLDPNICNGDVATKFSADSEFWRGLDIEGVGVLEYGDITQYGVILPNAYYTTIEDYLYRLVYYKTEIEKIDGVTKAWISFPKHFLSQANDLYYVSTSIYPSSKLALDKINVQSVWNFTTGSEDISVGILDTGIASHEDLNDNYTYSFDYYMILGNNPTFQKVDNDSHGTHVAGIIGAVGNNNIGMCGVNWDVNLVQMRFINEGSTLLPYNETALQWAIDNWETENQIRIINYSVGSSSPDNSLKSVIEQYTDIGGLFVCAAGNEYKDIDNVSDTIYPAYYGKDTLTDSIDNIIVVGALNYSNQRAWFSNWGDNTVDIYAPGMNILSTVPMEICVEGSSRVSTYWGDFYKCECVYMFFTDDDSTTPDGFQWVPTTSKHVSNGYHYKSGTSQAAPFVSGVAALLLSVNPDLTAAQLKECILGGADDIWITVGDNNDISQSVKKLNAWGAFVYLMNNYPSFAQTIGFNDVTYTYNIDADAEYMKDHTAMMKLDITEAGQYTFTVSANDSIDVKFYDNSITETSTTQIKTNNNGTVEFTLMLSEGTYYLRTNYVDSASEGIITVAVDCPPHTHDMYLSMSAGTNQHGYKCRDCGYIDEDTIEEHSFDGWVFVSDTLHRSECECGARGSTTAGHVFIMPDSPSDPRICMGCGYTKFLGGNGGNIITSISKVTVNGSYQMPDGTVYLVDSDIEAYLNGTLVFYDKDDLPVVQ